jgi:carboxypeptidase Taq
MNTPDLYQQYVARMHKVADLNNANAVLQWDQETYLPPKGAAFRGQQISTLSELSHQLATEDSFGDLLQELSAKDDLSPQQKRNIERSLEDYTRSKKYPSSFVRAMAEQVNKTFHSWIEARKQNSFAVLQDDLAKLVELKKQETELLGYNDHPYNALLDEFEKGSTVALLDKTFAGILPRLKELLNKIAASPQVNDDFLRQEFPKQKQWDWGMFLLKELHFDFESGRQDISEHPFSISFNPSDVRITTRVDENDFSNMTWSCIHEAGHALYEQGLPSDQYGLPLGQACSYSIHESQSRLWENNVGRSRNFCKKYFPELKEKFSEQFRKTGEEEFFRGINKVQPSLVRTEADEITYHMHVFVRYELEKKLIEGSLATADIPAFWKEKYKELLDVEVKDDKRGSLQDVHWSHGSFGYFPTYSLGSFYAAQFYATAAEQIPGLENEIANGKFTNLLHWLKKEIHSKGRFYNSEELCEAVTGKTLDINFFVDYLLQKYGTIYTLQHQS